MADSNKEINPKVIQTRKYFKEDKTRDTFFIDLDNKDCVGIVFVKGEKVVARFKSTRLNLHEKLAEVSPNEERVIIQGKQNEKDSNKVEGMLDKISNYLSTINFEVIEKSDNFISAKGKINSVEYGFYLYSDGTLSILPQPSKRRYPTVVLVVPSVVDIQEIMNYLISSVQSFHQGQK